MLGMMFIAEFITSQIPITGPFFGEYYQYFSKLMEQMTNDNATLILLAVVMAPLFEEIVFRDHCDIVLQRDRTRKSECISG